MIYAHIRTETRGKVALIIYDRQERRNAWGLDMYREIVDAIERANADDAVGAIVVTNAGPVFCAGADNKDTPAPPDPATGRRPSVATESMADDTSWLHLLARSKPNIVAVSGRAIGMGATQLLAFDLRMGGQSSSYGFPFLALNTMPELGATALLARLVGFGRAMDIVLNAKTLNAEEALAIGLITRIVSDAELTDEAVAMAQRLAAYPALQMKLTKEMMYANAEAQDANVLLKRERDAFIVMMRANRARAAQNS